MADMQIDVAGKKLNCHRAIVGMYADGLANRLKSLLKRCVLRSLFFAPKIKSHLLCQPQPSAH